MSIKYFDRVFGIWIAFLLILLALIGPMILMPFVVSVTNPVFSIGAGLLMIYLIPAAIILIFLYLPAITIGLTRTYMILTADDEYDETLEDGSSPSFIGSISQVIDIISIYNIDEVIFCSKNIPHQTIIDKMTEWKKSQVDYKIAPEDSLSIIGSNSIHTRGDLYTVDINAIDRPVNKRNKRLIDVIVSMLLILLSPVFVFFQHKPFGFISNIFRVLFARKSWVGYYPLHESVEHLPKIKPGVLNPIDSMKLKYQDSETISNLNLLYARDYNVWKDLNIILFAFRNLGNQKSDLA